MKTAPLDPFGFIHQSVAELPRVKLSKLKIVAPIVPSDPREDLTDEREEELKRGLLRYTDFLALRNMQSQKNAILDLNLNKEKKHARAYKKIRDFESLNLLKGYNFRRIA